MGVITEKREAFAVSDGRPPGCGAPSSHVAGKSGGSKRRRGKGGASCQSLSATSFDETYVVRTKLLSSISSSLNRDGLLVLCGEYGLGRHVLARQLSAVLRDRGSNSLEIRLSGLCPETICRKVRNGLREALALMDSGSSAHVLVDGLGILDDPYLGRVARSISHAVLSGCKVIVLLDADCESMLEFLPSCHIVRANELVLDADEYPSWEGLLGGFSVPDAKRCTHGIPSLLAVLRGVRCLPSGKPNGSAWDRVVGDLLDHSLRSELIREELALRCAMCALGSGDLQDLASLGIRVSRDIFAEIADTAPLFGVNLDAGIFDLIPCDPRIVAARLAALPEEWEPLLSSSVRILASQGRLSRAAAIASSVPNDNCLRLLARDYPLEMIDAGQARVLLRTVVLHPGEEEFAPARQMLAVFGALPSAMSCSCLAEMDECDPALVVPQPDGAGSSEEKTASARQAHVREHLKLVATLREVRRGGAAALDKDEELRIKRSGVSASKLLAHIRVLEHRLRMRSLDAFRELLVARDLREQGDEPSTFAALLAMDFESLRVLVGDPEAAGDLLRLTRARETLEGCGIAFVRTEAEAVLRLSLLVSGGLDSLAEVERLAQLLATRGETLALAWVELVLALASLSCGAYRNAHVRAYSALEAARRAGHADLMVGAGMAERSSLCALRENARLDAVWSLEGEKVSADIALLSSLYEALLEGDEEKAAVAVDAMRGMSPRVEVMALSTSIAGSDKEFGMRLAGELPLNWKPRRPIPSVAIEKPRGIGKRMGSRAEREAFETQGNAPLLEICVMGGFCVLRGGMRIPEREWRRRRSRDLASMLALTPGHTLTRRELIAELWQDADPIRGRESLYSVLSSLRTTIGQNLPETRYIVGEQGKLWLDPSIVACDVDEFERLARQVMGRRLPDDEAVSLCLRMEAMYAGGSYLPACDTDGRYRRRHEELSRRYVDAMMTGADAARRLKDERQAQWFLETARIEDAAKPGIALA